MVDGWQCSGSLWAAILLGPAVPEWHVLGAACLCAPVTAFDNFCPLSACCMQLILPAVVACACGLLTNACCWCHTRALTAWLCHSGADHASRLGYPRSHVHNLQQLLEVAVAADCIAARRRAAGHVVNKLCTD
ncbi:hypothetical protein COO60DRAFT_1510344 [Scenedesmus sp. NREL 46B-D3]|nr:hypothetical protein COO60DRAFT_1510344 [Scenedesmus sp. NREL 46B-D3]